MATLEINGQRVQVDEGFRSLPPEQQQAVVEQIAAGISSGAREGTSGATPAAAGHPGILQRMIDPRHNPAMQAGRTVLDGIRNLPQAAEGVFNDINAGMQGINPVAAQEAVGEVGGQAIGEVIQQPGGEPYVSEFDGRPYVPLSEFPDGQFITVSEGGRTLLLPRGAVDSAGQGIEEGPLASAGRLVGYGVPNAVASAARTARPPSPRTQAARAADDLGITPSFGMGGTGAGKVAAAGEQFAPTATPFRRDAARVTEEIATAADRIADLAGPGITPFEAGEALQRGGNVYVRQVRDFQGSLYDAVNAAIPPQTRIGTPETAALLRSEVDRLAEVPNIAASVGNTQLAGWLRDLDAAAEAGGLSWDAARALRTSIGESIGTLTGPARDVASGRLRAIYGKLSRDLDAAAEAAGPEAVQAWNRANTYKRVSETRIEQTFERILKADTPERAYDILTGMASEGTGRANISALRRVLASLPEDDAAVVAGTVIRRLGRAAPGAQNAAGDAFSPATFLTNWNRMSPQARDAIAGAGMDKDVGRMLTQLATVVERAKETGTFRNTSNTGNAMSAAAMVAWFFNAPVSATATTVGSRISAEVLTNPRFLQAVNRYATRGDAGALRRLAAAAGEPGAIEAATILRLALPEASSPQMPPAAPMTGVR